MRDPSMIPHPPSILDFVHLGNGILEGYRFLIVLYYLVISSCCLPEQLCLSHVVTVMKI